MCALRDAINEPLHLVAAEGDSTDGTYELLVTAMTERQLLGTVLRVDHGGPKFGSVNDPVRWTQIALVWNTVMDRVTQDISSGDRFLAIESDLVAPVDTFTTLLNDLKDYPAVSPMSMHGPTGMFYDTYGHVKNGIRFKPWPPHHPDVNGDRFVEIDSSGSCWAMRSEVVPTTRFSPEDCPRGIGRTLKAHGYALWLDQSVDVIHP
jgi:hypothetical protein